MALTKVVTDIIGSDTLSGISGSFRGELSSSVYLRQVSSTISGSLGANASVIRTLDRTTISGSIPQALATNSSPTFAAGTITGDLSIGGTLTAQEVHTEFESASILFTSGSTRFGDDTTDTHRVTGSMDISGSLNIPHGDLIVTDNIGIGTDSPDSQLHVVAAGSPSIRVTDTTNTVTGKFQADNSVGKVGTQTNHSFELFSNNTTAVTIDTSQNVGIGTTTMDAHVNINSGAGNAGLHVESTDSNANISMADNAGSVVIAAAGNEFIVETGGTASTAGSGAGEAFRIDDQGLVGIGTNDPKGGGLHIHRDSYPQLIIDGEDNNDKIGFVLSGSGARGGLRWNASNNDVEILREGGGVEISLLDGGGTEFAGNLKIDRDADGGNAVLTVQNSAGAGSTDETAQLVFNHTSNSTLGAKIVSVRNDNYNVGGNQSSDLHFTVNRQGTATTPVKIMSNGAAIEIDQNNNHNSIFISHDGTQEGVKIDNNGSGDAIEIENTDSTAMGLHVYSNKNASVISQLVRFHADNSAFDQPVLQIINDGTSFGQEIVNNGNGTGLIIQTDANGARCADFVHSDSTVNTDDEILRCRFSGTGAPAGGRFIAFEDSQARTGMIQMADGDNVAYTVGSSDINTKKNFEDWDENVLEHFKALKPKRFHYKRQEDSKPKNKGYIAQDVKDAFPEAYPLSGFKEEGEEKQYYGFNPSGMVVYLMKAVQELSAKVEELEERCNCE